ncbi:MAG: class I SAM-dependent methyltransferase [Lentisphaerae bacterium]|nr:class I SAM-dependent methyltransferase [Lentisphaerota bacterium]
MKLLYPTHMKEYELIDTGGFEKLERFGAYVIMRPESQAVWDKSLPSAEWKRRAHAVYTLGDNGESITGDNRDRGTWERKNNMPEQWMFSYSYADMRLALKLALTSFGHIGIFPEQSENWNYIHDTLHSFHMNTPRVLNLFAYTGAASLAAKSAGADVVHVDSVKHTVSWARENMEASGLSNIRWIVEDALKYAKREVNRGNSYNGIILDPPKYGRGPKGERWLLDMYINEIMGLCSQLLAKKNAFLLLNLYSMGYSAVIADNLIRSHFGRNIENEFGELYIADTFKKPLPLGVYSRFRR